MAIEDSQAFEKYRERQREAKAAERVYSVAPNNQRGELLEEPPSLELVAKRRAAREKSARVAARAIEGQGRQVSENYHRIDEHLHEIARGVLTTSEDGLPKYVEFDRPDVPEQKRLEAEYEKARRQEDPVAMARSRRRLEAVRENDATQARELEVARAMGTPDSVSEEAGREAIEDYIDEPDWWEVTDEDGAVYAFDTKEEAQDFADELSMDEIGDRAAQSEWRSTMEDDED
jgi:hypothetical protein